MITVTLVLEIIKLLIGLLLFYYVVKAAVRNGMTEAFMQREGRSANIKSMKPEKPANAQQMQLQHRYENGEISFEAYQAEWNKLSS